MELAFLSHTPMPIGLQAVSLPIIWSQGLKRVEKQRAYDLEWEYRGREFLAVAKLTTVTGKEGSDGQSP